MRRHAALFLFLLACAGTTIRAQIPAPTDTTAARYHSEGATDQPFSLDVIDARRTVSNSLLLRLALTNHGTAPMGIKTEFSGSGNPAEAGKISALYVVDPNGRRKYTVLRNATGQTLCSKVEPPIQPGERRLVYAQMEAPPDTTSAFELFFPKAQTILNIPIGLPQAGEPLPPEATITAPAGVPAPSNPVLPNPGAGIAAPTNNNEPDVYTNQTNLVPSGSSHKAVGSVESANSTVPFTVEVLSLKSAAGGAVLSLALTNGGSGNLDAAGQFAGTAGSLGDARQISGVYLVDPASKGRFEVVRPTQTTALCSKIERPFDPGERRVLEAHFPTLPATVKSVYVYFPHAAPITDVPVTR